MLAQKKMMTPEDIHYLAMMFEDNRAHFAMLMCGPSPSSPEPDVLI